ncbi:MAG: hypothetical protein HFE49_04290, partial [Clostridia bacterium]|nr:hypothetical protein [Clostridia bacterium]
MKRIISILITVSVLLNVVPALAEINDNDETEISAEAPWDISDEAAEAEPTQIPQTETYYTVDETESEAEKYEPMVHTEIITDDIELPEEEYNLMGTVLPNPFDVSLFSETNTTASVWNEMFSTQFGDDYLKPYEKKADGQRVSGNTNRLTIEETDLSLPGKNGLDFVLKRRHDNQDYNRVYSLSGNNGDTNEQTRYMAAFKNTSTNERIYIAFYTEDDFYTYMYNGNRLIGLKNIAQYSYKKDGVTYSFYKFEDIYNKITDSTSYDFYAYDSTVEHGPFTYFEDGGSQYDIASWNLLLENNSLGDNWNLVMPDVFLYKYSNEITHNKENSIYRGEYSGAFRDLDGNIYNLEGNDIYTKNSASTGKEDTYTSTFSCKNNRYLKIEKLLKEQTLNNGLRYNFTVKDNRGYTYYFYDPAAVESLKRARKQIPRIVAVEDIYGNRITYEYDSNFSYISTITDTYGREINIEHNSEKTIVSYYDDTEGETKTITYETSTLPASELDNDSPIKQKNVERFTVTNQLGEKTIYDAREAKVINAHRELSVDINEYPKVYYDTELHSTNSNIERIIYPTGAETRYKYKCQYYQSDESKLMRGAYAVVASYDISDGKEVNKREYSFTNSGREVTSTEINESQKSKTVRQYNDDGLLREQRITATDVKGSPYISTAYVYDTANKPKTITVNNNGVKNISSYQYVDGYPDLLTMETSGHKKIRYTYHMNDSRYTDKVKTAQHYNGNYIVSTELTSDGKSVEYERVTQNDVIKSQVKYSYDSEGNVTLAKQWTSDSNGDGILSDSDEYTEINSAYTNTAQKTRDITNTVTGIENADGADEGSVTDMFKLNIYGYPTYKKDSYGTVTTVEYDALNRPVKYNMPNGGTRTIEYNTQDKYTIVTDEAGIQYKYIYDDLGRIKEKYRIYGNHSSRQEMY